MGKTPKKNKNKKKKNSDLAHRLRRLGLRKELAKRIAENAETARGQIPKSARKTIKEMRAKVDLGAGVFRATQGEDPEGKAPEADAEAAKQQKKKNKKQEKASAKKLSKKAKKLKKKAMKKAKRVRKAARAKAERTEKSTRE
jgi:hypothetical protein